MEKKPAFKKIKRVRLSLEALEFRNFKCPEYDSCLKAAAFQNLDFNCADCSLKNMKMKGWVMESELTR